MQTQFDIHEAETHFSQLIKQVETGGEVIITRAGQPIARLVRIDEAPKRCVLGRLEGHFRLPDESALPIPETPNDLMASFDGRGNIADQLAMPAGDEIDVDGPNFRDPPQVDQDSDGDRANRPSDRTRIAIEELEDGRGKTFADVDDLMRDLQTDD